VSGDLTEFRGPVPRPASGAGGMGMPKRPSGRFRTKASPTEWERLRELKMNGVCRVCDDTIPVADGIALARSLHHVVFRSHGGDDVADNLVPVHNVCHDLIHQRDQAAVRAMLASLTDAEYAYAIGKGGEGFFERCYGLIYERVAA
jgi:hypothetical protein